MTLFMVLTDVSILALCVAILFVRKSINKHHDWLNDLTKIVMDLKNSERKLLSQKMVDQIYIAAKHTQKRKSHDQRPEDNQ